MEQHDSPDRAFDVFVSYSTRDHEWVGRYLVPILNSWGLKVAIDSEVFNPGDKLDAKIEECLRISRRVLFVCTKHSYASRWCRQEVEIVVHSEPDKSIVFDLEGTDAVHPDLQALGLTWCHMDKRQDSDLEWSKLRKTLGGTESEETKRIFADLRDLASFFGGFMNNLTDTYVLIRGHNVTTKWNNPTDFDHALPVSQVHAIAPIYALLGRIEKVEKVWTIVQNDDGDLSPDRDGNTCDPDRTDANFIGLGGASTNHKLLQDIGGMRFQLGDWAPSTRTHPGTTLHFADGRTYQFEWAWHPNSYFIYKSATGFGGRNFIWLFGPSGESVRAAAHTLLAEYWTYARNVKASEVLCAYERPGMLREQVFPQENRVVTYPQTAGGIGTDERTLD